MMTREQFKQHKKKIQRNIPPLAPKTHLNTTSGKIIWNKLLNSRALTIVLTAFILCVGVIAMYCGLHAKMTNDYLPSAKSHITRHVATHRRSSHHHISHYHKKILRPTQSLQSHNIIQSTNSNSVSSSSSSVLNNTKPIHHDLTSTSSNITTHPYSVVRTQKNMKTVNTMPKSQNNIAPKNSTH